MYYIIYTILYYTILYYTILYYTILYYMLYITYYYYTIYYILSDEVNMFRPISLLDSGGKVLENLLINRINRHVFSRGHMNENQFGFRPQKSTVDAAMAIKSFVQESLDAGEVIALISFDVQEAFDAAWWPGVLSELKDCKCLKNLYKLTMSYFTKRTATLSTNSLRIEKAVTRGCRQGSCYGPGFWNLHFNSLLELKFMARTKVVAYADDFLVATRGDCTSRGELHERRT